MTVQSRCVFAQPCVPAVEKTPHLFECLTQVFTLSRVLP